MSQYAFTGSTALDADDNQVALSVATLVCNRIYPTYAFVTNGDAAGVYIKLVDSTTYDVSADAPDFEWYVAPGASVTIPLSGMKLATGLCMASTDTIGTGGSAPTVATVGHLIYEIG